MQAIHMLWCQAKLEGQLPSVNLPSSDQTPLLFCCYTSKNCLCYGHSYRILLILIYTILKITLFWGSNRPKMTFANRWPLFVCRTRCCIRVVCFGFLSSSSPWLLCYWIFFTKCKCSLFCLVSSFVVTLGLQGRGVNFIFLEIELRKRFQKRAAHFRN